MVALPTRGLCGGTAGLVCGGTAGLVRGGLGGGTLFSGTPLYLVASDTALGRSWGKSVVG